ncbi:EAL domain-containing protein [Clostridium sp. DL1XJH146]
MKKFNELIDLASLQKLIDSINKATGISVKILNPDGDIIINSVMEEVCYEFFRKNTYSAEKCKKSECEIIRKNEIQSYALSKCLNGLYFASIPFIVEGEKIANIFFGQFFMEEPNEEFFRDKGNELNFDNNTFMEAIKKVPVKSEEQILADLDMVMNLRDLLVETVDRYIKQQNDKRRYRMVLQATNEGVYDWNIKKDKIYYSTTWKSMMKYDNDSIEDNTCYLFDRIHPENIDLVKDNLKECFENDRDKYNIEYRIRKKTGEYFWVQDNGTIVKDENKNPIRVVAALKDISERKKWERTLFNIAYYDELTGLPNRTFFKKQLALNLEGSIDINRKGAMYFVDIDDFKKVNDILGHEYGDELLIQIAEKLKNCVGKESVISRFGGDEFLVLKDNLKSKDEAIQVAEKIQSIFSYSIIIKDFRFYVTASIGIALFPENGNEVNEIIKNADTAVNIAKRKGKNTYVFYEKEMFTDILKRTEMEKYLREALENKQFYLNYQPIIDTKTGKIISFEALLRWKHPKLGLIPPDKFISLAEETGLIIYIGEWVIREACKQNKKWIEKGFKYRYISVNVSEIQFQQSNFLEIVEKIIHELDIPPEYLAIEITESILMKSLERNIIILKELKKMGIHILLDDFGTGYSSLNYLTKIPINSLKIDKSFIDNICVDLKQKAITAGIIHLAHQINLDVIAEGVELQNQLEVLDNEKCDKIQGYFFSKPVMAKEAEGMLENDNVFLKTMKYK